MPEIVAIGRGQQEPEEDPGFESRGKYAYIDALMRNVITPLASRFETDGINIASIVGRNGPQQRNAISRSIVSLRASERPREASWA